MYSTLFAFIHHLSISLHLPLALSYPQNDKYVDEVAINCTQKWFDWLNSMQTIQKMTTATKFREKCNELHSPHLNGQTQIECKQTCAGGEDIRFYLPAETLGAETAPPRIWSVYARWNRFLKIEDLFCSSKIFQRHTLLAKIWCYVKIFTLENFTVHTVITARN